jgi:2-C-methyl-D-erythritol 4-phosphate cytidylyltransferase
MSEQRQITVRPSIRASAIIVAAGSGRRLGFDVPKAFVPLGAHPMLYYAIRTISSVPAIVEAVIAVPPGMESQARDEVNAAKPRIPVKLTPGGAERQDSVRIALALTSAESDLVIVHDAARPFATPELFAACLEAAARAGGAIAAVPVADTLKQVEEKIIRATVPRANLWQAQTPQAFRRDLLIEAHRQAERGHINATDDADLVEQLAKHGQVLAKVEVVESSVTNLKITTPADLTLAEILARG